MYPYKTNKYGNKKTEYKGRMFDSIREANHASLLDTMKKATNPRERVASIIYQYPIPIVVNNVKIAKYVADFYVMFADGHKEVHETKGFQTPVYKIKKKLVEAIYGIKIMEF